MSNELLILLEQQHENFENIKNFNYNIGIRPSTLFLPQVIKSIGEKINDNLIYDCLDYLDIMTQILS